MDVYPLSFCVLIQSDFSFRCIGCYSSSSLESDYNATCANYKGEQTGDQTDTDNKTRKKNAATSDKTCSWRMLGLAVAGGLTAVM